MTRRHYQCAIKNKKDRSLQMRKFAIKPGIYYLFSPIRNFKSKKRADAWIKQDKYEKRNYSSKPYYRIVNNNLRKNSRRYAGERKYTVFRAYYP